MNTVWDAFFGFYWRKNPPCKSHWAAGGLITVGALIEKYILSGLSYCSPYLETPLRCLCHWSWSGSEAQLGARPLRSNMKQIVTSLRLITLSSFHWDLTHFSLRFKLALGPWPSSTWLAAVTELVTLDVLLKTIKASNRINKKVAGVVHGQAETVGAGS